MDMDQSIGIKWQIITQKMVRKATQLLCIPIYPELAQRKLTVLAPVTDQPERTSSRLTEAAKGPKEAERVGRRTAKV